MKKWKKILALLLVAVMICSSFPVQTKAVEDYRTWSQADERWGGLSLGTSDKTVKSSGCLVTSIAKLMIQCGLKDEADFNPAVLVKWLNNNGGFSGSSLVWAKPAEYVDGFSLYDHNLCPSREGDYSIDAYTDTIIQHIKDGLHIVLQVKNGGHWVAVDEAMTLANGEIYIMDTLTGKENADIRLKDRYEEFNRAAAYKGGITPDGKPEEEPEEQPEEKPEEVPDDTEKNPFVDVKKGDYYYDPVMWAYANNITTGTDADHFSPNLSCNRAQIVTFLWRAKGCPDPSGEASPFVDVTNKDAYYYDAVLWACENGITTGINETHFDPEAVCTREQIVTFLWRAENCPESNLEESPFEDVTNHNAYYYDAVLWACENNITTGMDDTHFGPRENCTRGQVVTFLYRCVQNK